MARRLAHSGGPESDAPSDAESDDDSGNALLTRRSYVALGTVAAALGITTLGSAASNSSTENTYFTDFSEGQL